MTDIKKGLAGVVVDTTAISKVNPETNSLLYRGYPVQELADRCSFEEVAYLLWHGELPDDAQLAAFEQQERGQRRLEVECGEAFHQGGVGRRHQLAIDLPVAALSHGQPVVIGQGWKARV